ncbi:hypothetical protein KSF_029650 [Reticulibacter mediterranei]|uniref:Uncharacterized protein n=1 Tax=Reticulibacter mediterranei TaxID=2778369 RepID=A0A8J3N0H3_9CHLR|nr:hypothetical protein KSF_029650 [Reticulibacter mediterranei]
MPHVADKSQDIDQKLSCPICKCSYFSKSQALLSTSWATLSGWDWANPNADIYQCSQCSFLLWFCPVTEEEAEEEVDLGGPKLTCTLCGETRFWTRQTLLSTRSATFLHIDWLNPGADNYICTNCAQLLWFAQTENGEEGETFECAGHLLACPICQHKNFWTRKVLLSDKTGTFFGVDWASPTADIFVCTNCTHILWFA